MRKRLQIVVGALLGIGLIWLFVRDLDGQAALQTIRGANWPLLGAACLLTMSTYFIRAVRWRALLEPVSPGVRLINLFNVTTLGFLAVFLVGRTGEIVRPVALSSKEHVRPSASLATILMERVFDMVTVVAFFGVDLLVFKPPLADAETISQIRTAGVLLMGVAVGSIFGLLMLHRHRVGAVDFLDRVLEPLGRRVRKGVTSLVTHFAEALSILHDKRELLVVSAWSVLLWTVCAITNLLIFKAFGLNLTIGAAIFVLGFGLVGSLVPTPGGAAGAFHVATAGGLILLGVLENDAKSIAIVLHLIVFGSALPLGVLTLLKGGYSLSRLRAALSEDLNSIHDFSNPVDFEPPLTPIVTGDGAKVDP